MRATRYEHDACLTACSRIRAQIAAGERTADDADADLVALNAVAGAYVCKEPVSRRFWRQAQELAGF